MHANKIIIDPHFEEAIPKYICLYKVSTHKYSIKQYKKVLLILFIIRLIYNEYFCTFDRSS